MDFRLNKIEPEVKQRINEKTKEGKIHSKGKIVIDNDKKHKNKERHQKKKEAEEKFDLSKHLKKDNKEKNIIIKAEVDRNKSINSKDRSRGVFLDTKK
ncbi:hypothetical protein [Clostridium oceanicum]|uniref:Uncharacterized protein n=1 Tax=Clostridium oceanicum TaxID=1543 RepID=A0ABN1JTS7_9CLOT